MDYADLGLLLRKMSGTDREAEVLRVCLLKLDSSLDGPSWFAEVLELVEELWASLPVTSWRNLAADLAWRIRQRRGEKEYSGKVPTPSDLPFSLSPSNSSLFSTWYFGQWFRFDFSFRSLQRFLEPLRVYFPDDALITALFAFAGLGLSDAGSVNMSDLARRMPDADWRTRQICLHGIWMCTELPDRAERIVDLASEMLRRDGENPNTYYRRAGAFRAIGKFSEATRDIERALEFPIFDNHVHQDYTREREFILLSKSFEDRIRGVVAEARQELEASRQVHVEEIRNLSTSLRSELHDDLRQGLFGNVQILGIFIGVVSVLATAGGGLFGYVSGKVSSLAALGAAGVSFGFIGVMLAAIRLLFGRRSVRHR